MNFLRFCFVCILLFLTACSTLPTAERASTPEATHSYVLAGDGSPTVILEAGLGDGKESWAPVYSQISEFARVFAYDRAGYGRSRSDNKSRDGNTIVRELRATLHALGLEPPFVLVGHSIGGTYMELFARSYPEDVAGVVFVDSRHADFTRRCQIAGAGQCTPPALLAALLPPAPKREMASGEETMQAVMRSGPFPQVPIAVLTSGKQPLSTTKFREVWLETQKDLARLSSQSSHVTCDRCGHYIHRDNPQLVVGAIKDVLQCARMQPYALSLDL